MPGLSFSIVADEVESLPRCPGCDAADGGVDVAQVQTAAGLEFLTTAVCRDCALIYRRHRPSLAWFERAWQTRDAAQRDPGAAPFNPAIEQARYERYARTARLLQEHRCGPRVIDIGCGPATGLRALAEAGFRPTGLEPDRSRARYIDVPGVEIVESTIERFAPTMAEQFDAVACQHSLEHFHDPRRVLELIASLIIPQGLIYIEVPDWRFDVKDWNDALYLAHQTNFVDESLVRLARRVGLEPVGRAYPPADSSGESHLALLFRRASHSNPVVPTEPAHDASTAAAFVAQVRAVYERGLPTPPQAAPLRFETPCINDISMTYKGNPDRVRATVRENFADRRLSYDAARQLYSLQDA